MSGFVPLRTVQLDLGTLDGECRALHVINPAIFAMAVSEIEFR